MRAGAKRVVYRLEDLDAWQERHLEHVGPTCYVAHADDAAGTGATETDTQAVP